MGDEFYRKGANVQLGPGLCLARVPRNGRNFEYVSGEDPLLGFRLGAAVVAGIQSEGVVANAKHWVNNNQETDRHFISENVDERTQFELYFPPFEGAIRAGLGSIMCSYNLICVGCASGQVGNWSCENEETLRVDLKHRLNFSGWVMSDWAATHSASIARGLDQEMPGASHINNRTISALLQSGALTRAQVADSAHRILWPLFAVGAFDKPNNNSASSNVRTPRNTELAKNFSSAGTVMLKNNGILPISSTANKTIAVIGGQATRPIYAGGGSGAVSTKYVVSPLQAICKRLNVTMPATRAAISVTGKTSETSTLTISSANDVLCQGGAAVTKNPLLCLRSGSPHVTTTAILTKSILAPAIKTIDAINFSYSYETGYSGPRTCGAQFNVTVAGKLAYASPILTDHPYSHSADPRTYGQPVQVIIDSLDIDVGGSGDKPAVKVIMSNNCRNLQLLLPLSMIFACSSGSGEGGAAGQETTACFSTPPPPPPPLPPGAPSCNSLGACVQYSDGRDVTAAAAIATAADVTLLFTGTSSREGADRANLNLGADDALIQTVANASNGATGMKTVVVVVTPGAILTPWRDAVAALLVAFMPGEQYGTAITELLWGDEEFQGRLPITMPNIENEVNMSVQQWPGVHNKANTTPCLSWHDTGGCTAVYSEQLLVGYRWYSANPATVPAYSFGAGLAFTTFEYSDLKITGASGGAGDDDALAVSVPRQTWPVHVSHVVANNGTQVGTEVPQLYLRFPASAGEPPQQLKGWDKLVSLDPGTSATASYRLDSRAFSIWDVSTHAWKVVAGDYGVMVGANAGDIRLTGVVTIR
jgi:beta-glucosidase-like glycosyl hydrolase